MFLWNPSPGFSTPSDWPFGKRAPNHILKALASARFAAWPMQILIHGFRGVDTAISSYFDEFVTLLTSRGSKHVVIVYDWTSVARPFETLSNFERRQFENLIDPSGRYRSMREPEDPLRRGGASDYFTWELSQYYLDQHFAETTGADGLALLLADMNKRFPSARINVIAHSMGCFVTEKALLKTSSPPVGLSRIIWLAPDVAADAMASAQLRNQLARLDLLAIFYSRDDEALKLPSRVANGGKRLGAVGLDHDVPAAVKLYDETDLIQGVLNSTPRLGASVHGAFLRVDTGIPAKVLQLLEAR